MFMFLVSNLSMQQNINRYPSLDWQEKTTYTIIIHKSLMKTLTFSHMCLQQLTFHNYCFLISHTLTHARVHTFYA